MCTHVFPAEPLSAFAAIDVADGVVAGGHLPVDWLAFDDIDARAEIEYGLLAAAARWNEEGTHTTSKRYARPCCPVNAWDEKEGSGGMQGVWEARLVAYS